jgi:hypothetical protein
MNIDSHQISCYHTDVIEFLRPSERQRDFSHCARESGLYVMPAICFALIWAKGVAGIFYIDNIANGRKDEAMAEYGPQFRAQFAFQ